MPVPLRSPLLTVALTATVVLAGCGGGHGAVCTEVRERADPLSGLHIVDLGAGEYESHPPTSGPHPAVPPPEGVIDAPVPEPLQVTILEAGSALIQWEGVGPDTVRALEQIAGQGVVVAPGTGLPAPIVATAWTWKLTCDDLDRVALDAFVATRPEDAPGPDR